MIDDGPAPNQLSSPNVALPSPPVYPANHHLHRACPGGCGADATDDDSGFWRGISTNPEVLFVSGAVLLLVTVTLFLVLWCAPRLRSKLKNALVFLVTPRRGEARAARGAPGILGSRQGDTRDAEGKERFRGLNAALVNVLPSAHVCTTSSGQTILLQSGPEYVSSGSIGMGNSVQQGTSATSAQADSALCVCKEEKGGTPISIVSTKDEERGETGISVNSCVIGCPAPPGAPGAPEAAPALALRLVCAQEECVVCLGEYRAGEALKWLPGCGHAFHEECVRGWLTNGSTCPVCRTDVEPGLKIFLQGIGEQKE